MLPFVNKKYDYLTVKQKTLQDIYGHQNAHQTIFIETISRFNKRNIITYATFFRHPVHSKNSIHKSRCTSQLRIYETCAHLRP